ncbi:hypothetical protein BR93DRAFT_930594 [Coniochaeta sp. PMI_546]|nr:hypothetical protein BR93DRAFT_930594 [Coniochaeta sp. PMI_546]
MSRSILLQAAVLQVGAPPSNQGSINDICDVSHPPSGQDVAARGAMLCRLERTSQSLPADKKTINRVTAYEFSSYCKLVQRHSLALPAWRIFRASIINSGGSYYVCRTALRIRSRPLTPRFCLKFLDGGTNKLLMLNRFL